MTCRHVQIRFQKFGAWWYIVIVIDQIPVEVDYLRTHPQKQDVFFEFKFQIPIISGAICLNTIPFNSNHFLKFTTIGNRPPIRFRKSPVWSKASMVPHSCDQWTRTVSHRGWAVGIGDDPKKGVIFSILGSIFFSLDRKSMKIPFLRFLFSLWLHSKKMNNLYIMLFIFLVFAYQVI